jgi:hypothetical protein
MAQDSITAMGPDRSNEEAKAEAGRSSVVVLSCSEAECRCDLTGTSRRRPTAIQRLGLRDQ